MSNKQIVEGKRKTVFCCPDPYRVVIIGLDTKHAEGEHELWDERIEEPTDSRKFVALKRNIARFGQQEAIKVRTNGKYAAGPYAGEAILEVVDGRRRCRAVRALHDEAEEEGAEAPPLKLEVLKTDDETTTGLMISLNELHRADDVLVKAKKAARLLRDGHDYSFVADSFGVTTQAVKQWEHLATLGKPLQNAVAAGQISASAAVELRDLSRQEQKDKLAELLAAAPQGKRPTARQTRDAAGRSAGPKLTKRVLNRIVQDVDWLEQELSPDAAALVRFMAGDADALDAVPGLAERLEKKPKLPAAPAKPKGRRATGKR